MFPLNYFIYLQIIIFLFITPGTPRIVIVSHSINYGVKKCLWTALGDISANTVQMVLVVFVIVFEKVYLLGCWSKSVSIKTLSLIRNVPTEVRSHPFA